MIAAQGEPDWTMGNTVGWDWWSERPETEWKEIVCLANSRKNHDRCVAGIEVRDRRVGEWVRPVSARDGHGVSSTERRLTSGREPAPLDVIRIPLLRAEPWLHQKENWLLDSQHRWEQLGEWPSADIGLLEDHPADLWGTGDSSNTGRNDRVSEEAASVFSESLLLVMATDVRVRVGSGWNGGPARVRAQFGYADEEYSLRVTDPACSAAFAQRGYGSYLIGDAYLTVSLGEPWEGHCYKLVAAVLEPPGSPLEGSP